MADQASDKKSKALPLLILVAFILVGAGLFFAMQNNGEIDAETVSENIESAEAEVETNEAALADNQVDISDVAKTSNIDVKAALKERTLGNPNAPIKISEHSSFSCGHCGNFHKNVFKEFQANWIDSGKAYLVFSDFPLNGPALHASMVSRCVAEDRYFEFVERLFAEQKNWAFTADHTAPLQAIAAEFGIDNATFKSCVENPELQAGLLNRVRAAQQQFNINSTPSFVVNNAVTVSGGLNYEEFNKVLEIAVEQSNKDSADEGEPAEQTDTPAE